MSTTALVQENVFVDRVRLITRRASLRYTCIVTGVRGEWTVWRWFLTDSYVVQCRLTVQYFWIVCASVRLSVTRVYVSQSGWLDRLDFWRGSYRSPRWHCFRWLTQLTSASLHIENGWKIPQKGPNCRRPLGVENVKGFQLQETSPPDPLIRDSAPGPRWGRRTIALGSRSALAMRPPVLNYWIRPWIVIY